MEAKKNVEVIEYFRTNPKTGIRFEIISKKGGRKYNGPLFRKKQDRLFFIRLVKEDFSLEFPYSYPDQHRLMELVMGNIILDNVFDREFNTFIDLMKNIKKKRIKEVNLDDFKNEKP